MPGAVRVHRNVPKNAGQGIAIDRDSGCSPGFETAAGKGFVFICAPRRFKIESLREVSEKMVDRREFLSSFAGVAALGGASVNFPAVCKDILGQAPDKLPDPSLYEKNEEAYWTEIRKQFLIPEDEVYLNNGTVGSSPALVLSSVFDGYRDSERLAESDPEDYPIWGYAKWNQFRDPLAQFVGCTRDELALVRNATEANSYIANGIDLKPGDEVLMTDQEHPGGEQPWNLRAKRYGVVVKKVTLPKPVKDPSDRAQFISGRDRSSHSGDFLQSHHYGYGSCTPGKRTGGARPFEGDSVRHRWRARAGNDETRHLGHRLRFLFLKPAQVAAGTKRNRIPVCA